MESPSDVCKLEMSGELIPHKPSETVKIAERTITAFASELLSFQPENMRPHCSDGERNQKQNLAYLSLVD